MLGLSLVYIEDQRMWVASGQVAKISLDELVQVGASWQVAKSSFENIQVCLMVKKYGCKIDLGSKIDLAPLNPQGFCLVQRWQFTSGD